MESLPTELIEICANFTQPIHWHSAWNPSGDLLALSWTCRRLRSICWPRLVFGSVKISRRNFRNFLAGRAEEILRHTRAVIIVIDDTVDDELYLVIPEIIQTAKNVDSLSIHLSTKLPEGHALFQALQTIRPVIRNLYILNTYAGSPSTIERILPCFYPDTGIGCDLITLELHSGGKYVARPMFSECLSHFTSLHQLHVKGLALSAAGFGRICTKIIGLKILEISDYSFDAMSGRGGVLRRPLSLLAESLTTFLKRSPCPLRSLQNLENFIFDVQITFSDEGELAQMTEIELDSFPPADDIPIARERQYEWVSLMASQCLNLKRVQFGYGIVTVRHVDSQIEGATVTPVQEEVFGGQGAGNDDGDGDNGAERPRMRTYRIKLAAWNVIREESGFVRLEQE